MNYSVTKESLFSTASIFTLNSYIVEEDFIPDNKFKGKLKCLNGIDGFLFDFKNIYQDNDQLCNFFVFYFTQLCGKFGWKHKPSLFCA